MASKFTHISDLIHRVASSCLIHHPAGLTIADNDNKQSLSDRISLEILDEGKCPASAPAAANDKSLEQVREMEGMMAEVFDAVSAVKRAYVSLQQAHSPWDPDKMRTADAAMVSELKRLGRARDRYRRRGGGAAKVAAAPPLSEAVAPYEAAIEDLRGEVKAREAEVEMLKEKLRNSTPKGKRRSGLRRGGLPAVPPPQMTPTPQTTPTPELFVTYMDQVKSSSKSFTSHLLSLMRTARWDIASVTCSLISTNSVTATIDPRYAKYALESYINRRLFQGFENETFYISGSLTSLLRPDEFRHDCLNQFRDMCNMDPTELLGILPTCPFGRFASKRYLAIVGPKIEESLFGGDDQRRQVEAGVHPRTGFYRDFLRVAKAVWMLHLLAFAIEPVPRQFEVGMGVGFDPVYMESVVRLAGGGGLVVGFSVSPGFKVSNGSVVKARVYPVPSS